MNAPEERPVKTPVQFHLVTERDEGQRLDNCLFRLLKTVPKTRIYRLLRKGEVRVNKKRVDADYRLVLNDQIRIPPLVQEEPELKPITQLNSDQQVWVKTCMLFENDDFMVINKPSGVSVHAGSDTRVGLIEALRIDRPDLKFIELAHRIDKETSGCLLIAKKPSVLKGLHALLRDRDFKKTYHMLVKGEWPRNLNRIELPVEGKPSLTTFQILQKMPHYTYVSALLHTGRQHQIRIHCQSAQHPIIGDDKYGDFKFNREFAHKTGLKRMFLHAYQVIFAWEGQTYKFVAPFGPEWAKAGVCL